MNDTRTPLLIIKEPIECRIIQRINRFVVAVDINSVEYRTCINNTGRLEGFLEEGKRGFCTRNLRPGNTDYRLFAIADGEMGAIIDTQLQMRAFEKAVEKGYIPWLKGYKFVRRNAPLGNSLIDYILEHASEKAYLEIKSAVLREGQYAMYPDCPTARGRKHIRELTDYAASGGEALILFIAALPNVVAFKPYKEGDLELYKLLLDAARKGVLVKSIQMEYDHADALTFLLNSELLVDLT